MDGSSLPDSLEDFAAAALVSLLAAARLGGAAALEDFRLGEPTHAHIAYKHGNSPVTSADLAVDRQLAEVLRGAFPDAGWLSEETEDDPDRLAKPQLLILDPIDGTRAFITGDPRWTVAVALVQAGRPVAGVVHAPALGETYAASLGRGATLNGVRIGAARLASLDGASVAGPRATVLDFAQAAGFRPELAPKIPSLAYRLACVASGRLALGLAGANSHDWDIAAADIILREAGAGLVERGGEVSYNQLSTRHDRLLAAPADWLSRLSLAMSERRA
jgi:myo-inositol-1(or 4)-monophosphatase